jgi:hypothetical protein
MLKIQKKKKKKIKVERLALQQCRGESDDVDEDAARRASRRYSLQRDVMAPTFRNTIIQSYT